ncbi:MAG: rod shape-determining protein RodA [Acidobacteria bacterium]|nr:MAG: rod shape-determining protein RodA [Acidobacteriota bacterium]
MGDPRRARRARGRGRRADRRPRGAAIPRAERAPASRGRRARRTEEAAVTLLGGRRSDLATLAHLVALGLIGVVAVASATHVDGAGWLGRAGLRQLGYVLLGVSIYLAVQRIDYRDWADAVPLLYLGGIAVLVFLLFRGRPIAGARSWIELGSLRIQPSEPMKAVVCLSVSAYLARIAGKLDLRRLVKLGLIVGVPAALVAAQPDMGTALTLAPAFVGGAWLAGVRPRVLVALALVAALAAPAAWFLVLKPYQKERILTVFDPGRDPAGSGYQVIQSRIAVGSGGVAGKGLFRGSQSRLDFLPARETDFILAVIAEETGFLGVLVVLGLYFSLLLRTFGTAAMARDTLGTFLCVTVACLWAGQVFVNAGMVTGILPTIGIPLPVVSYGGSSVAATFLAFGLVGSVRSRRFVND